MRVRWGRYTLFSTVCASLTFSADNISPVAAQPQSQASVVVQGVGRLTQDRLCNLRGIPTRDGRPAPSSQAERVTLYLRCEAKGGRDEWSNSCCDHLTSGDSRVLGRCPTTAVGGLTMSAFRQLMSCQ